MRWKLISAVYNHKLSTYPGPYAENDCWVFLLSFLPLLFLPPLPFPILLLSFLPLPLEVGPP